MSADANAAFLYRTIADTESIILEGAAMRSDQFLELRTGHLKWARPAMVLPYAGNEPLEDIDCLANEMARTNRGKIPAMIMPADEDKSEDARSYAYFFDYTAQRRSAYILKKPAKLKGATGVVIDDGAPEAGMVVAAAGELAAQDYGEQDFWEGALGSGALEVLTAQIAGKHAGMVAALKHGIEYRLCALFTAQAVRGKGVGRTMMLRFLSDAAASGAPLITAVCSSGGTFGYYLERFGFAQALEYDVFNPPTDFRAPK